MSSWNSLLSEMERLRQDFDRVAGGQATRNTPFSRFAFLPGKSARAYPLMNLCEDEQNLYVEALAPGLDPDQLEISITRNQLNVSGVKTSLPENLPVEGFHRRERATGRFSRSIYLDSEVDSEAVKATYENGLLRITLQKSEEARPRKIEVRVP